MSTVLDRLSRALFGATHPLGCPPDCIYEYLCSGGFYYSRRCCYNPNCTYACAGWVNIGTC